MTNLVIIKLYRNDYYNGDVHDILVDHAEQILMEMRNFAKSHEHTLLFCAPQSANVADFDTFAEISYTQPLTQEQKDGYVKYLLKFATDGKCVSNPESKNLLQAIIYTRIAPDQVQFAKIK